jgi:hypothetical protein
MKQMNLKNLMKKSYLKSQLDLILLKHLLYLLNQRYRLYQNLLN